MKKKFFFATYKDESLKMAAGMCQPKYQILYDFKIEVVIIHLTTMFKLLVVLFIIDRCVFHIYENSCNGT